MKHYYALSKIIVAMLFIGLLVSPVSATLLTSSASPDKIFKCGESTISANFSDAGITSVNAILTSMKAVQPMIVNNGNNNPIMQSTTVALSYNGTYWVGTFGDDSTLLWGERAISYNVTNGTGSYLYSSGQTVFVYSDECTGTGKNSYQNYTTGIGTYTNMLVQNDTNIIVWSLYPWIQYWGYLFYVVVLFITVIVIYLKTQNAMHVMFTMLAFLLTIAALGAIPLEFRSWIITIIALILGAVLYRLYVRD